MAGTREIDIQKSLILILKEIQRNGAIRITFQSSVRTRESVGTTTWQSDHRSLSSTNTRRLGEGYLLKFMKMDLIKKKISRIPSMWVSCLA